MAAAPDPSPRRRPRRWPAVLALVLGLGLTTIFGVRAWNQWQYAQRVARGEVQVEALRGWMTLPYIARTYRVPEAALRGALGVAASGDADRSLREWFEVAGIEPLAGRRAIEALILVRQRSADEQSP